jgi:hypothetical protein
MNYLSQLLRLKQVPAFEPYIWFGANNATPLQSMFLILTYLEHISSPEDRHVAGYLVNEVIKIISKEEPFSDSRPRDAESTAPTTKESETTPWAWKMLLSYSEKLKKYDDTSDTSIEQAMSI